MPGSASSSGRRPVPERSGCDRPPPAAPSALGLLGHGVARAPAGRPGFADILEADVDRRALEVQVGAAGEDEIDPALAGQDRQQVEHLAARAAVEAAVAGLAHAVEPQAAMDALMMRPRPAL